MQKTYNRINWENYPSDRTPLNETNLNKLDVGVNELDNRIITLDNTKFDKTEASQLIKNFELDKSTGIITITYLSGATATIDTMLEKLAINFDFDKTSQKLVIVLDDGTVKEIDLTALITEYEFKSTDTVAFSVDADGNVSAIVKDGSIQERHLRPNYLSDIMMESAKAEASAVASDASAIEAENSAIKAESFAVGGTNTRTDEDTDNAKFYYEASKQIFNDFENVGAVVGVKGDNESDYRTGFVNITAENVGALPSKVVISQVNFDDLKTTGVYHIKSAVVTNRPTESQGTLIVDFSIGTPYQLWIPDYQHIAYKRIYQNSSTWSEWSKMEAGKAESATQDGNGNVITNQYMIGKLITDNVDFNDMQKSGIYHIKSASNVNKPTGGNGTLFVEFDVGTPYQIWMQDNQYVIYKRTYSNSVWSEWSKMEAGNADSANAVVDYNDSLNKIQIGWRGDGVSTNEFKHFAAYISDDIGNVKIKNLSLDNARSLFNLNRFSLSNGRADVYTGDLNDIDHNSIYNVNLGTDKNSPYNGWGFVITMVHNYATTHISQIWVGMTNNKVYYRYKSGSWIGWVEMTQNTQILNTATAIEASTSDDNIVGAKGLKEYAQNYVYNNSGSVQVGTHEYVNIPMDKYNHHALIYITTIATGSSSASATMLVSFNKINGTWVKDKDAFDNGSGAEHFYCEANRIRFTVGYSSGATVNYSVIGGF